MKKIKIEMDAFEASLLERSLRKISEKLSKKSDGYFTGHVRLTEIEYERVTHVLKIIQESGVI